MAMPAGCSTAPVVTMMNHAMTHAAMVPDTASARCGSRSLGVRPFSTTFDCAKNIIHGAMVVPIMAMTSAMNPGLACASSTTVLCSAAPQSGWAMNAATT